MSKKKFSEGLDDLFKDTHSGKGSLFSTITKSPKTEPKTVHKNFLSDLDALLQEALEESLGKYEANQPDTTTPSAKNKSGTGIPRNNFSGLDSLIRQTIDVQEIHSDEVSGKKRLTVAVDKTKLEKLKVIARLENAYLKDLLVNLIDGYISDYTQQKGIDL
jgi:hypothetical protein